MSLNGLPRPVARIALRLFICDLLKLISYVVDHIYDTCNIVAVFFSMSGALREDENGHDTNKLITMIQAISPRFTKYTIYYIAE
jgi:hypothetical protein